MQIGYTAYLDAVYGGWIGKSIGGTIGARFEGKKSWNEITPETLFPETIPFNDDLDLQILWLKVLEEKGPMLTTTDLADAWHEWCWYDFNEYGIFRKNWRQKIAPPMSGKFDNQFWETGMGCPIRSEIWGYVFPGRPELAVKYAYMDGSLDHTDQSVGAELMFSAMASMAFWVKDIRQLSEMFWHYLPKGSPIDVLSRAAFECYDQGYTLRDARERLMALGGHPEACDAQTNVPLTFLALLYGQGDFEKTIIATVNCGYDVDCTAATACAFLGQMLGASRIPQSLKKQVGDDLVMGIEYKRKKMTLKALAEDTARVGVMLAKTLSTNVELDDAPKLTPPRAWKDNSPTIVASYPALPAIAPGQTTDVDLTITGTVPQNATVEIASPAGFQITPKKITLPAMASTVRIHVRADETIKSFNKTNLFDVKVTAKDAEPITSTFGLSGASLWRFLGVYWDACNPDALCALQWRTHFVDLEKPYISESKIDTDGLFRQWSKILGRPALIAAPEMKFRADEFVKMSGPCCIYLARTILVPDARKASIRFGCNNPYRCWLNGEKLSEQLTPMWWTPTNNVVETQLKKGANTFIVKLIRHADALDFSMGIHTPFKNPHGTTTNDYATDIVEVNPLPLLNA